jgi:hypothetical protein
MQSLSADLVDPSLRGSIHKLEVGLTDRADEEKISKVSTGSDDDGWEKVEAVIDAQVAQAWVYVWSDDLSGLQPEVWRSDFLERPRLSII